MSVSWLQLVVGAWVAVSPWVLGMSGDVFLMWSNLLAGLTLVVVNLWDIYGDKPSLETRTEAKSKPERRGRSAAQRETTRADGSVP